MRVCHCVGNKTNPGGVCCQDLPTPAGSVVTIPYVDLPVGIPSPEGLPAPYIPSTIKSIEYYPDGQVKKVEYSDE